MKRGRHPVYDVPIATCNPLTLDGVVFFIIVINESVIPKTRRSRK